MSSKKTVKMKELLAQVNTSAGLQYRMGNVEQNIYNTKTELEFEIECPRCYDNMTLCSALMAYIISVKTVAFYFIHKSLNCSYIIRSTHMKI